MKKILALLLAAAMIFTLVACSGKQGGNSELAGTYDITVWCADNIVDLTTKQIADFNASNTDGITFNATVEPVGENDAATQMITDVEAGGDIFCFAQDQFARLVQAGALSKLGSQAGEAVKAANDADAVKAVTLDGELWAYPMTSDNGYFMYYDKSVIPEEDIGSLEKLIADCEAAEKYFSMETETSAWYIASFFFGAGCVSEWTTDVDGNWSVNDTFNSPEGLIACKGMKKLVDSDFYLSSSDAAGFDSGCAIVVTGTWGYETAKNILGDNLGAAELPSFEVDGQSYHMGSFSGFKLMGVKPQTDAVKAAALHKLAQYLTGEQGQMERFEAVAWGPSNVVDQQSDAVKANPAITAVVAQKAYATPQGQIHGSWWDIAKVIGTDVKNATDEAGLQAALDNYYDAISALFNMSEEEKNAFGVIGTCNLTDGFFFIEDYGTETRSNWTDDIPMEEVEPGVWKTTQPYEMEAGVEFKCRQGGSWDVAFPADNFKVEEAGTYYVVLTLDGDNGVVTLEAA